MSAAAPGCPAQGAPVVRGVGLDGQTRCIHWHSPLDVVAITGACCDTYYACKDCHDALADHMLTPWPPGSQAEMAVRCGICTGEMTIAAYLACGSTCPRCRAAFNPGCRNHYPYYFALDEDGARQVAAGPSETPVS